MSTSPLCSFSLHPLECVWCICGTWNENEKICSALLISFFSAQQQWNTLTKYQLVQFVAKACLFLLHSRHPLLLSRWRLFPFLLNYSLSFCCSSINSTIICLWQQHASSVNTQRTTFFSSVHPWLFFLFSSRLNLPWKKVVERYRTGCIGMQSSFSPFCCDMKTGCEGVKRESLKVLRRAELMCKQKKWQQPRLFVEWNMYQVCYVYGVCHRASSTGNKLLDETEMLQKRASDYVSKATTRKTKRAKEKSCHGEINLSYDMAAPSVKAVESRTLLNFASCIRSDISQIRNHFLSLSNRHHHRCFRPHFSHSIILWHYEISGDTYSGILLVFEENWRKYAHRGASERWENFKIVVRIYGFRVQRRVTSVTNCERRVNREKSWRRDDIVLWSSGSSHEAQAFPFILGSLGLESGKIILRSCPQ